MFQLAFCSGASSDPVMEFLGEGIGEATLPQKPLDHLQMQLLARKLDPGHFSMVTKQQGTVGNLYDMGLGSHGLSLPGKRKAPMEPTCDAPLFQVQRLSASVKKGSEMELPVPPWLHPSHVPNRKVPNPQPSSKKPACKIVQKNLPLSALASSNQNESAELVRSKLKESLAAALALVSPQEGETPENHATEMPAAPQASPTESMATAASATAPYPINPDSSGDLTYDWTDFQSNGLNDGDVSFSDNFFARDELLQMHGLSWVMGSDVDLTAQTQGATGQPQETSEGLASKIEAELFKLFGGVNKKYKEKGRSLLFNLKDSSNPELREKVMCGEIPPSRLCSMTAEELASRELSEWRMAKAEKLAQMVVLPDSSDVKRLVKKTHKGEFQVELDHTDSMQPETGASAGSTSWPEPKQKESTHDASDRAKQVAGVVQREDDEFKDTDFLPPIVSLDEFIYSIDPTKSKPSGPRRSEASGFSRVSLESKSPDRTGKFHEKSPTSDHTDAADTCLSHSDADGKLSSTSSLAPSDKVSPLWEGTLQLNVNGAPSVTCIYKSGDRGSTAEWPKSIEIKGRVRLDAFDKFLQQLPKSKSRSLMVVHFVCKDGGEGGSIQEVAESYVADARVGFAEPAVGVEFYFCPAHPKMLEMLIGALPKGQTQALGAIDEGLIGVVVWRKSQTKPQLKSTVSPKSAPSRRKPNSKKQCSPSIKQQQKFSNSTETQKPKSYLLENHHHADDEDDDLPPGFDMPASHDDDDDDDLPDFNFSGSTMPKRVLLHSVAAVGPLQSHLGPTMDSVEKMRELVHKYGQSKLGIGNGNSHVADNNDDDDGMPEWQPEAGYTYGGLVAQPQLVSSSAVLGQPPLPNGSLFVPSSLMLPTQVVGMPADPRTMGSMWQPNGWFGSVQPIGLHAPAPQPAQFHQDMP